jgi:hypothetical protein
VGLIEYRDVMGTLHHTGFCWYTYYSGDRVRATICPSPLNSYD